MLSPASDDDLDSPQGFSAWVERLGRQPDRAVPVGEGRVHATHNGGVLADMRIGDKGAKRRYWITLEAVMRPRME